MRCASSPETAKHPCLKGRDVFPLTPGLGSGIASQFVCTVVNCRLVVIFSAGMVSLHPFPPVPLETRLWTATIPRAGRELPSTELTAHLPRPRLERRKEWSWCGRE